MSTRRSHWSSNWSSSLLEVIVEEAEADNRRSLSVSLLAAVHVYVKQVEEEAIPVRSHTQNNHHLRLRQQRLLADRGSYCHYRFVGDVLLVEVHVSA